MPSPHASRPASRAPHPLGSSAASVGLSTPDGKPIGLASASMPDTPATSSGPRAGSCRNTATRQRQSPRCARRTDSLQRRPTRPIAIARGFQVRFEDRLQDQQGTGLHHAVPVRMAGRRSQGPFRGLLGLHSRCGPSTRRPTHVGRCSESFSDSVTLLAASVATGMYRQFPGQDFHLQEARPLSRTFEPVFPRRRALLPANQGLAAC
jgi:hypothetical protein